MLYSYIDDTFVAYSLINWITNNFYGITNIHESI